MSVGDSAPPPEVVEVSLFGPGSGECVVVHLGASEWMIVDSCQLRGHPPVSLEYLRRIGVNLDSVRLVVATHWHDDHIAGLAEVLAACRHAKFVCSEALARNEWTALVEQRADVSLLGGSGVDEYRAILGQLAEHDRSFDRAAARRLIWSRGDQ